MTVAFLPATILSGENTLEITGALTGAGVISLDSGYGSGVSVVPGGELQLDSSASSSQTIDFLSASGSGTAPSLRLMSPSTFSGTLESFDSVGDSLELVGQFVTSASITGSTLTVNVLGGSPAVLNANESRS